MNLNDIEVKIKNLIDNKTYKNSEFIYEFLLCFDLPKASITRLKKGDYNIAKDKTDILWKKKIFFKECSNNIYEEYSKAIDDEYIRKNEPLFIVLKDHKRILALDLQVNESIDIEIEEIKNNYTFFLPLAGMKKINSIIENPADTRAAEKMMKMYSEIKKENNFNNDDELHELNLFFARLLFCFFSEDTGIFEEKIFTKSIKMYTQIDGSDLYDFLNRIFIALDTEENKDEIEFIKKFPYVGGDLFGKMNLELKFNGKIRSLIIEIGELDWSEINPDIFGSMIQAVVNIDERANLGMHYTSVPNIMKVLNPLFLDSLNQEFDESKNDFNKLEKLLMRLNRIKIFDPACGSGNFLIIAYKELRELEMKVLNRMNKLNLCLKGSTISLVNFYGIEIKDFAQQIARLSLWLMKEKMDFKFYKEFGYSTPSLPLKNFSKIELGNSLRVDWNEVCPRSSNSEIYLVGNPPYLGSKLHNSEQKKDLEIVFEGISKIKELDYISCWFYKGAKYIKDIKAKCAFVSTNSICQGEQVSLLWPHIFKLGICIDFAYKSFKWTNNAKANAGVTCIIVGLANNNDSKEKVIYDKNIRKIVKNINPYLIPGKNICIKSLENPMSKFPEINFGNMPNDNGNLILSDLEKEEIIKDYPYVEKYIYKLVGAQEFIKGNSRWCIWLNGLSKEEALEITPFKERILKVESYREKSSRKATQKLAETPHLFGEIRQKNISYLIVPSTSSERREYIPIGFLEKNNIVLNSAQAIFTEDIWIFGVITSAMHMLWVKTVGGRLKTDYRYSKKICYNTFPFPTISIRRKNIIEECVYKILEVREKYSEKKMADLYDPDKMPSDLREAHRILDLEIDKCYRPNGFKNDDERLECLFNLYEEMV
ncbi:N-6 DNA methylase [Clostridium perfringens]|nr:N-6 DNA methylase [Clostridium perfringens]MDK0976053.1 N-6 DNA methylase [Clostridium perfringens]